MKQSNSSAYAAAGVDVNAGYEAVKHIKPLAESTFIPGVLGSLGGFGGLFAPDLTGMNDPVLVSGTDGVGTKLKLAMLMDKHDTIGVDCVAMCVNDIICSGASPLIFLDYIACGKNVPERVAAIVSGVAEGCRQAGCALIGGETAEHPGMMPPDDYDLAGFSVGLVDREKIIDGSKLREGDVLIGISSSGVHSNGFSLVRQVFGITEYREPLDEFKEELGETLGEALLKPTRIYANAVHAVLGEGIDVHAICHITGGGFYENVPRMMSPGLTAKIALVSFPRPPIFDLIQMVGELSDGEMYSTFNMGLGMILAVRPEQAIRAVEAISSAGEQASIVGTVVKGDAGVELVGLD